ncbi:MAG: hypothetical protein KatS3mg076_1403 [Candidatus Binatia bacterium]|nr:MAG: hypothetical protein KatS3mg076_1403 [Candidatus Binatia bacterium]
MNPSQARTTLHLLHLLPFLVLLATGLLLRNPDLRSALVGGYSLVLRRVHLWAAIAFCALPLPVFFRHGVRTLVAVRAGPPVRTRWRRIHTAATLGFSSALAATGFLLSADLHLPERLLTEARSLHAACAVSAALLLVVHLLEVSGSRIRDLLVRTRGAEA